MKVECCRDWDFSKFAEVLVVAVSEDWKQEAHLQALDQQTQGWFFQLLASEEISSKPLKLSSHFAFADLPWKQLITVGIGNPNQLDPMTIARAAGAASKLAAAKSREATYFYGFPPQEPLAQAAIVAAMNGCVGQDLFKAEPNLRAPGIQCWIGVSEETLDHATIYGESILFARRLINLPANHLAPQDFVDQAQQAIQGIPITMEVWDEKRLEQEKCGSLLAVARGSAKPPRLIKFHYAGTTGGQPIALVGKGVTFDSGGLSLKPSDSMITMKCDMSGAATVLASLLVAARRKLPQPIVGLVGLVENMIDGDCFRLGDVLTARSGKTIEIHNTDAEGRLVLADVLNVALDSDPKAILDFATLTGACVVALGTDISGVMSNSPELSEALQRVAKECGELIWPLPMHPFFAEQIAGKIGDIKNMGEGRWGGAITAAKFLEAFVENTPWVHFDIAGPAFYDNAKPWQDAGGTGTLIRTIGEWLAQQSESAEKA